ncbi:secondary thiamine-phosphate synthase enzyme YjbQ [Desulfurispira natronophila]|uniref:Secondary thiamine-phosphate synthase enzyme n=1 Tax=Desulfurispira natronophila TaxID=682562 RepID=A0A7W7Y6C1_9BACT|nr:secondary thiamine-phosphate synthase enzyme YjbQ [Desulfurispira natronophila]MBB5022807.1 secondary thiamine-phosphate synthase enzyme [Desulfurispira natronophila]
MANYEIINIKTTQRCQINYMTDEITRVIKKQGWKDGILLVFTPHTTAAVAINESEDPHVQRDTSSLLSELIPIRGDYGHAEGNSDAHIKSTIIGCSEQVIVDNGQMVLASWQGVYFCEFDGPRARKLYLKFIAG